MGRDTIVEISKEDYKMEKKKLFKYGVISLFIVFILYIALFFQPINVSDISLSFDVKAEGEANNIIQIFYMSEGESDFNPASVQTYQLDNDLTGNVNFHMDENITAIRVDFGNQETTTQIENIKFTMGIFESAWTESDWNSMKYVSGVSSTQYNNGEISITSNSLDPYIIWGMDELGVEERFDTVVSSANMTIKILATIILSLVLFVLVKKFEFFVEFPTEIWRSRGILFQLAKNDFKTRFAGSYLGIIWAFVQPIVTVLVYWFVFEKGLRSGAVLNVPFVLWLIAGIIPWFFFSDALSGGTNALLEYQYLVKKVVFQISVLPLVKVIANFFVHIAFIVFAIALYVAYGYYPDVYYLQIFYYSFCVLVLVLGLSYATSALVGFFRDLSQIIGIFLQVGVWMTPIMWNMETMNIPEGLKVLLKANPMYYIVAGYRDTFINKVWFWENMGLTVYFWIVAIIILGAGMIIFKRLKPHFADVL